MKQDKAMLNLGSSTFLEVLVDRASNHFADIRLLAGNRDYNHLLLPAYRDEIPDSGPLSALMTACRISEEREFAIHTVDAPLVSDRLLDLMANFNPGRDVDAVFVRDETNLHPLSGIFKPRITPILQQRLKRKELAVMRFISSLNVHLLHCNEHELINANRPEDYNRVKRMYGKLPS